MVASMKPEALEKMAAGIPLKRLGEPQEVAHTARFILENDYISGRVIELDAALDLNGVVLVFMAGNPSWTYR